MYFILKHFISHRRHFQKSTIHFIVVIALFSFVLYMIITHDKFKRKKTLYTSRSSYQKLDKEFKIFNSNDTIYKILPYNLSLLNKKRKSEEKERKPYFSSPSAIRSNLTSVKWCKKSLSFIAKSHRFHTIALASFPGSGNTWLRYLLQQATGILTGSVYDDMELMYSLFPGI